ncbi:hypothetical protein [Tuberibacillus sp. Marseille-P3662]|uniref:hypothetical protein n=1 Tax=Tuberibacillus sp. Marseille-P3662 TaxID=1965358 RepID=UPI0015932EB1|nr:hypothetical protein [Tuberibacillus sp. Marseille-P3662]
MSNQNHKQGQNKRGTDVRLNLQFRNRQQLADSLIMQEVFGPPRAYHKHFSNRLSRRL